MMEVRDCQPFRINEDVALQYPLLTNLNDDSVYIRSREIYKIEYFAKIEEKRRGNSSRRGHESCAMELSRREQLTRAGRRGGAVLGGLSHCTTNT
ncbi:hypothetical protein E2C01_066280 [Portunus trituberculatus]|uniref:Uncharacterized protein n=1 Tax=Portunus trituberculatus TaxID=210409 RepID=A0A5B7HTF1_PORTR|nr:hypothetical protein [Portunus trituberculatus]